MIVCDHYYSLYNIFIMYHFVVIISISSIKNRSMMQLSYLMAYRKWSIAIMFVLDNSSWFNSPFIIPKAKMFTLCIWILPMILCFFCCDPFTPFQLANIALLLLLILPIKLWHMEAMQLNCISFQLDY